MAWCGVIAVARVVWRSIVPFVKRTRLYQTLKVITSFVYRKMMMAA